MSMSWFPYNQGKWLANNLGPTIRNHPYLNDTKIFSHDDSRSSLYNWMHVMYKVPDVDKYLDGFAFHWYFSGLSPVWLLDLLKYQHPDKIMLSTESSAGYIWNSVPFFGQINKPV